MCGTAIRHYSSYDENAVVEMWLRTWKLARPDINFSERESWLRRHLRDEWRPPFGHVCVAEQHGVIVGFAVLNPTEHCLEQIAVAPEVQGRGVAESLLQIAKSNSPHTLHLYVNRDNPRAIAFYEKHGFVIDEAGTNALSGLPIFRMIWTPNKA